MIKKIIFLLLFCCSLMRASCQEKDLNKVADSVSREGKALFRSEFASWYGTDIFAAKCPGRRAIAGGYISYDDGRNLVNVFYSNDPEPKVLSTITFGYDLDDKKYGLDTTDREFTPAEKELYTMRKRAVARINKDTTFKTYSNAELNPVPIILNGARKVYVLTGTNANGVVLFGNDYRISFDKNDYITSVKKMHNSLIVSEIGDDTAKIQLAGIHNHLPKYSDFITPTDICTLMLYEKFTTWHQYIVISKKYASVWDCKTNTLAIYTVEAWEKRDLTRDVLEDKSH
jgi:hypothetical protein